MFVSNFAAQASLLKTKALFTIPHMEAVLVCYCCYQLACMAKLSSNMIELRKVELKHRAEEHPQVRESS